MAIRAYADEHGVGIFDEEDKEDYETSHFCHDLRLDDIDSFLAFTNELLAASKEMGWFTKAAIQYVLTAEK